MRIMRIVIDIPEEIRRAIINNIQYELNSDQRQLMISYMENAILNGTPLDYIKAEITEYKDDKIIHSERNEMIDIVLEIIDKHI